MMKSYMETRVSLTSHMWFKNARLYLGLLLLAYIVLFLEQLLLLHIHSLEYAMDSHRGMISTIPHDCIQYLIN